MQNITVPLASSPYTHHASIHEDDEHVAQQSLYTLCTHNDVYMHAYNIELHVTEQLTYFSYYYIT